MYSVLEYFAGETRTISDGIFPTSSRVTLASTVSPGGDNRGARAVVVRKTFRTLVSRISRQTSRAADGHFSAGSFRRFPRVHWRQVVSAVDVYTCGVVSIESWYEITGHSFASATSPAIGFSALTARA